MILFDKKNLIMMADGTEKPITELQLEDEVRGYDGKVNTVQGILVTNNYTSLWNVNGDIIVSAEQPFMSVDENKWHSISSKATAISHPYLECTSIDKDTGFKNGQGIISVQSHMSEDARCIMIELDGDHTFIVNTYVLHNGGGGSRGGGNTTTVQKSEPPAYLQPYLTDIAKQAQNIYAKNRNTPSYTGDFLADPNANQQGAVQGQLDLAQNLQDSGFGSDTMAVAQNQTNKLMSDYYTSAARNTFDTQNLATPELVDSYLKPVERNLTENILPALESDAITQGAYGGSRYAQEQTKAVRDNFTEKAADIATQIGYGDAVRRDDQEFQNFAMNQELMPELLKMEQAAAAITPELTNAAISQQLMPIQLQGQAGTQLQAYTQAEMDDLYQQYLYEMQYPWMGLDNYASIVSGVPGGGTATTQSLGGGSGGWGSGALSGGLGGLGTAAAFGLSMTNPVTAGLGLGGAILGGLFS